MGSEHVSSYEVIYEEDTPLYAQLQAGKFAVDEDLACAMYDELVSRVTAAGFRQYEIANFARDKRGSTEVAPNPERNAAAPREQGIASSKSIGALESPALACQHNVNYWRGGSFYGLGPSATGYIRGVRTKNWSNTQLYCEQLEKGVRAIESREELPPLARAGEIAAFGLRMVAGWPFEHFRRATGHDLREDWAAELAQLTERGWGQISSDRFQLTPQGLRFADAAAELFLR
jgi:oxygen-independent coproporphyrinogen-3 oxidase